MISTVEKSIPKIPFLLRTKVSQSEISLRDYISFQFNLLIIRIPFQGY